ncbi:sigma-E processing peptidase SpoIIGA [Clostridium sp.]|uniref:sigma-E processing peptidase SpoIIGA n=1 Tax=Clostridium sp. TaxID=1506 RepID=UPI0039F52AC8
MVIYLDVFIIENFIVNFFLLYITSQTIKIKTEMRYLVISSVLGTLYAVVALYTKCKYLFYIPLKCITAIAMILILFRKKKVLVLFKAVLIFLLYSMLLAGLCIFIEINNSMNINIIINKVSYKILLSSIMLIYIFIHRIVVYVQDRREMTSLIYDVDIVTNSEVRKVKAFLDTGNELREPATNLPVMIVEKEALNNLEIKSKDKFYIPYKVINGFSGKLEGFKPKYINIYGDNGVEQKEVIVALCNNMISEVSDYNALLSRGIL